MEEKEVDEEKGERKRGRRRVTHEERKKRTGRGGLEGSGAGKEERRGEGTGK